MELEIIIIKFSCILKMMSRNTFPEPQPDIASFFFLVFFLNETFFYHVTTYRALQVEKGALLG